jgi:mono/diheme cytochrome c family protein
MVHRVIAGIVMVRFVSVSYASAADVAAGPRITHQKCAGGHGEGGAGNGVMLQRLNVATPPVPWTDKTAMGAYTDADLTKIISGGGGAVGKAALMPAFGGQLSDAKIADVVAYIRSLAQ